MPILNGIVDQMEFVVIAYFVIVVIIAVVASRLNRQVGDYLLGSRRFGPFVTALAAGASDMSSWLMMALPGVVYSLGVTEIWMPVGLLIGAYCNWRFVAKRLRVLSQAAGDANTVPQYLANRFADKHGVLQIVTALTFVVFFTIYAASSFVGLALLFHSMFHIGYVSALIIGACIILVYAVIGGFIAVNWIDVFQGSLMLFALLFLPMVAIVHLGGLHVTLTQLDHMALNLTHPFKGISGILLISLLAWGLGYFGQPHILVRFMASHDPSKMHIARRIGMGWMLLSLCGAVAIGIVGVLYFTGDNTLGKPATIVVALASQLLSPTLVGVLVAAILSAIMSTVAAQLLVSSSAMVEDIIFRLIKHPKRQKTEITINRLMVVVIGLVSIALALSPGETVLDLVSFGWAGLGAAFGPVILLSLYWRRASCAGAMLGIVLGGVSVLLWHSLASLGGIFLLYEMVPGFIACVLGVVIGSLIWPANTERVASLFEAAQQ